MKSVEGLLRYDVMDTENWCFDMGYQLIPASTGMEIQIRMDDRYLQSQLLETSDGRMTALFDGSKKNEPWSHVLELGQRYPARMDEEAVEQILNEFRLLELQHEDVD